MFDNRIVTISFLLTISLSSQLIRARPAPALPDLTSEEDPSIHFNDPIPNSRTLDFPKDKNPIIIRWCAPVGLGLNNNEAENDQPNNSYDPTHNVLTIYNPDDCTDLSEERE